MACHFVFGSVHFGGNVEPDSPGDITNTTDPSPIFVLFALKKTFHFGSEHRAKHIASLRSVECFCVYVFVDEGDSVCNLGQRKVVIDIAYGKGNHIWEDFPLMPPELVEDLDLKA